ncbi:MAG: long-chain fatty acid--CoA ligase, partial [Acidimicrobiia bacterium]|nr:long-chain fatty acid--CoA ligase [Acidimicrobiia bacterium]
MSSPSTSTGQNLAGYFARGSADDTALLTVDGPTTVGQLVERVARWRAALTAAGVGKGDRVAILDGNSVEFVLVHVATVGIGAISVPLNHEAPALELVPQLETVDPAAIFVGADAEGAWLSLSTPLTERRLPPPGESAGDDPGLVAVGADAPALPMFTSGTAGTPKAAILTHGNLLSSLQSVLSLPIDLVNEHQTYLGVIPLFH